MKLRKVKGHDIPEHLQDFAEHLYKHNSEKHSYKIICSVNKYLRLNKEFTPELVARYLRKKNANAAEATLRLFNKYMSYKGQAQFTKEVLLKEKREVGKNITGAYVVLSSIPATSLSKINTDYMIDSFRTVPKDKFVTFKLNGNEYEVY